VLILTNPVSSTVNVGTTFSFTVNNIKNPYNGKKKTGFTITTLDSGYGEIDSYTNSDMFL
jgi:hypothetical protein